MKTFDAIGALKVTGSGLPASLGTNFLEANNCFYLRDDTDGKYYRLGLKDGQFYVDAPLADANIAFINGNICIKDDTDGNYYKLGRAGGEAGGQLYADTAVPVPAP